MWKAFFISDIGMLLAFLLLTTKVKKLMTIQSSLPGVELTPMQHDNALNKKVTAEFENFDEWLVGVEEETAGEKEELEESELTDGDSDDADTLYPELQTLPWAANFTVSLPVKDLHLSVRNGGLNEVEVVQPTFSSLDSEKHVSQVISDKGVNLTALENAEEQLFLDDVLASVEISDIKQAIGDELVIESEVTAETSKIAAVEVADIKPGDFRGTELKEEIDDISSSDLIESVQIQAVQQDTHRESFSNSDNEKDSQENQSNNLDEDLSTKSVEDVLPQPAESLVHTHEAAPRLGDTLTVVRENGAIQQVSKIVHSAQQTLLAGENKTLALTLNPSELGRVNVELQSTAQSELVAKIYFERAETLAAFQNDMSQLKDLMKEIGIQESNLELQLSMDQGKEHFSEKESEYMAWEDRELMLSRGPANLESTEAISPMASGAYRTKGSNRLDLKA